MKLIKQAVFYLQLKLEMHYLKSSIMKMNIKKLKIIRKIFYLIILKKMNVVFVDIEIYFMINLFNI